MLNIQQIDKILEPVITGLGYEFVCVEIANVGVAGTGGNKSGFGLLRILIDKVDKINNADNSNNISGGITAADCKLVSKQISRVLLVEAEAGNIGDISSKYGLEVSSPGIERPLVTLAHFKRFIGKKVKIRLNQAITNLDQDKAQQKNYTGYINDVTADGDVIILDAEDKNVKYQFAFDNIDKANLVYEW